MKTASMTHYAVLQWTKTELMGRLSFTKCGFMSKCICWCQVQTDQAKYHLRFHVEMWWKPFAQCPCPAHECHRIRQAEFNTISAVGPETVHNMVSVSVKDHLEEAKCLPEQQDVVQVVRSFDKRRNIPSNPSHVQETPEKTQEISLELKLELILSH